MPAEKRLKRLSGNIFGPPDSDMRMKGFEVRFEAYLENGILNPPVQRKEMRMPFPHSNPNHRYLVARLEDTDAAQRQEKRRNPYFAQCLNQPFLPCRFHFSKKTEGQMKLFLRKPAQAG